jgi:site-specific recombinase XerD
LVSGDGPAITGKTDMKPPRNPKRIEPWHCEGLRIHVRAATFHVGGTLRVGKQSKRVRETLGIEASAANRSEAERKTREIAAEVRRDLGGGVVRKAVSTLVAERFKSYIGPSDRRILEDFTGAFTTRILWTIAGEEIVAFVDTRQQGNTPESRERYISGVCSFLNLQIAKGQYEKLPPFIRNQKARNPQRRARRAVAQFRIDFIEAIVAEAHISNAIQLRVEWVCGARVSSILQGCSFGDLDLKTMTLTFRDTKNGEDVPVALPESLRNALLEYLRWRAQQVRRKTVGPGSDQALFLTYKGRPYKPNGGEWGTQNKTAFNAAKRRAVKKLATSYDERIAAMEAAGDQNEIDRLQRMKADDLKLLAKITQHWMRHKFATDVGRRDPRAAMNQGGWLDVRSLHGYMISDAEHQRHLIEERGSPDTNLTQVKPKKNSK